MAAFEVYLRSAWQVRPGFSLERVQHSGISFWSGGTGLARNFAAPALAPKRWGLFLQWAGAMLPDELGGGDFGRARRAGVGGGAVA